MAFRNKRNIWKIDHGHLCRAYKSRNPISRVILKIFGLYFLAQITVIILPEGNWRFNISRKTI